jgi:hypothetical protein
MPRNLTCGRITIYRKSLPLARGLHFGGRSEEMSEAIGVQRCGHLCLLEVHRLIVRFETLSVQDERREIKMQVVRFAVRLLPDRSNSAR